MKTLKLEKGKEVDVKLTPAKGKLNWFDLLKGAIMAVGTPMLYVLQEMIPNWPLNPIEKAGLSAFVTYMLKNVFDSQKVMIDPKDLEESRK